MSVPIFFKQCFQLGYVTPDLDRAVALYGEKFGVTDFLIFSSADMNPDAPDPIRVGLAWTGDIMIELIEPGPDHPLYACAMPPQGEFGIQLHHLGYLVHDEAGWRDALASLEVQGSPVVSTTELPDRLQLVYADARPLLGHHLEIIWLKPGGAAFFDGVPRN